METSMPTQVQEVERPEAPPRQDIPRVAETTLPPSYKYKYQLFDGLQGERYLLSLAQRFAPLALWRTWYAAVSYQAPDDDCYVGVTRLTDMREGRVNIQERKVYLDLEALEARGWLQQERVQKPFKTKDGSVVWRVVPAKYFDGFYDTAYEYHQWLYSETFVAPERKNVRLILADTALTKKLIHFENYRRLLMNAKPGPKSAHDQDFYTCQLEKLAHKREENGQDGQYDEKVNQQLNPRVIQDSVYRRPGSSQPTSKEGTHLEDSTFLEKGEGVAAQTIRNLNTRSSVHTSNPNSEPQEEAQGGAAAQEAQGVLGYTEDELRQDRNKRGAAMAGIPADQYAKLNGGQDQAEREEAAQQRQQQAPWLFEEQLEPVLPARPEREVPPAVIGVGRQYAQQYDDAHLISSDITRFKKLYATAEQALPSFQDAMYWERFDGAKAAADKRARKRTNSKGFVTRVPYLFTCLENAFEFSLEELVYLRSEESLSADCTLFDVINTMRDTYNRQITTEQTDIEYRTWLCEILDEYEKCKEPKVRLNATTRAYPCESPARL